MWKERVSAYKESGQSVRSWCKDNDLKEYQLRYWLEKYDLQEKKKHVDKKWILVDVKEIPPAHKDSVITVKIGQAIMEVKPGFDPVLLKNVVQALNVKC